MYHAKQHCFCYRDRDTHITHSLKTLLHQESIKNQEIDISLDSPQRLVISIMSQGLAIPKTSIILLGVDQNGKETSEVFTIFQGYSTSSLVHIVSEQVYSRLRKIETSGEDPSLSLDLATLDLSSPDITCLLPISGDLLNNTQLQSTLKTYLQSGNPRFHFGLPEELILPKSMSNDFPDLINLPWNFLLIESLLDNKLISVASDLFSRIMTLIAGSLKHDHAFFEYFNAKDGSPKGHRHSLSGIVPISLYLSMIGLRIISPTAVEISGECPFPGKILVKYCGMQIMREGKVTRVILPNGQITRIYGSESHIISQK
jgi:hypothetical protein